MVAGMAAHEEGPIRYQRVFRKAPRRFWWLWALAAVAAVITFVMVDALRVEVGLYWVDFRPALVSAAAIGYAIYFLSERPRTVRGSAMIQGTGASSFLVDGASKRPIVGRGATALTALSFCNDPRDPERILASGNFANGDEFVLGAPATQLTQLRQILDVPTGGTGWVTFGQAPPRFPVAAALQLGSAVILAAATLFIFWNEYSAVTLIYPIQLFIIFALASIFLRTPPRPFVALGAAGIRASFVTIEPSGRWRDDRVLPWAAATRVEDRGRLFDIVEARGEGKLRTSFEVPALDPESRAALHGQVQDAVRRAHGDATAPTGNDALSLLAPQDGEPEEAWRARLEVTAVGSGGYRGAEHDVDAWAQAMLDPDSPPKVRVAAGYLLTRVAPERISEVSGILEDLRDEEARSLAHAVLPRPPGHRNDL